MPGRGQDAVGCAGRARAREPGVAPAVPAVPGLTDMVPVEPDDTVPHDTVLAPRRGRGGAAA